MPVTELRFRLECANLLSCAHPFPHSRIEAVLSTMKVDGHEEKVVRFFDQIAHHYNRKYDTEDPLRHYFFTQRLEKSTAGLEFDGKTVLDTGSGTGTLYDYLAARHRMAAFYACDISEEMLSRSWLPPAQRFVGKAYQTRFPIESFDYIYMLGVTTYMPKDKITRKYLVFGNSSRKRWDGNHQLCQS